MHGPASKAKTANHRPPRMPRIEAPLLQEAAAAAAPPRTRVRRAVALLGAVAVVGAVALCVVHFTGADDVSDDASHTGGGARDEQTMDHTEIADEYNAWRQQYGSQEGFLMSQAEMNTRIKTFAVNKQIVNQHNERYTQGQETFNMTLGPFADMTAEQFAARFLDPDGAVDPDFESLPLGPDTDSLEGELAAGRSSQVDWRSKYVTSVKNQRSCGSCWAFSAAGAIEGAWAKAGHGKEDVSPQAFVDCSRRDAGCNGGLPSNALSYAKSKGWASERQYPYAGSDRYRCTTSKFSHKGQLSGPYRVTSSDSGMYNALQQNGPISVAIDAGVLQNYHSGVISRGGRRLDHAVLLVAGDSNTWTVKNSWGTSWGERGYFRLQRSGGAGVLGINQQGVYVTAH
jgi:C1A family cysteine protease